MKCKIRNRIYSRVRERTEDLDAQVKERDILVEELVLSNQTQLEKNETLTVQNEDLRGEFNEVVRRAFPVSHLNMKHRYSFLIGHSCCVTYLVSL